jgi:CHAD domain-containing protein
VSHQSDAREATITIAAWSGLDLATLVGGDATLGRALRVDEQRWTLDTADHRLARADIVASRLNSHWTVRCAAYGAAEFDGEEPPADLTAALSGVCRGAPLVVASRIRRQGRALPVTVAGEEGRDVIGHVRDEDVSTLDGRRVVSRQRYVTVEGTRGLVDHARRYLAIAGMQDRALKAIPDTAPLGPPDPLPWPLEDRPVAGTVAQRALARSVAKLLAHDPVVRLDLHLEGVHQMRVAIRRLRSDLRTFGDLVGPLPESLVDDLKWLGGLLGAVRDLDVLRVSLEASIGGLDPADRRLTNSLVKRLNRQREAALAALEVALAAPRYHVLVANLVDLAERPPLHDDAAGTAVSVLVPRARKAWRRLRRAAGAAAESGAPIEAVHAMRLRAKQFRYAVDALVEVDSAAKRHARLIGRLQDALGELNDAVVAEAWLRDQAGHEDDPKRAFLIGQLVAAERAIVTERLSAWRRVWRPVKREDARAWLEG